MANFSTPLNLPLSQPTPTASSTATPHTMSVVEHLAELRRRIVICLMSVGISVTAAFFYAEPMVRCLERLAPTSTHFVQLAPGEVLMASFKLAMFAGIGLALPIILFQLFLFVSPGLKPHEKKYVFPLLILGLGLFVAGILFGYWIFLPLMLEFLLGFGQSIAQLQMSIGAYLNFCLGFLFATALVFQLPLFLLFASFLRLVSSKILLKQWRWALVLCFALGAIITPSVDIFSQSVMAVALAGLYGFSIGLIRIFGR